MCTCSICSFWQPGASACCLSYRKLLTNNLAHVALFQEVFGMRSFDVLKQVQCLKHEGLGGRLAKQRLLSWRVAWPG